MFFHHFKYDFLTCIRNKGLIFWLILFPAVLGTLFKVAFSGLYDSVAVFKAIPVAIVTVEENAVFDEVISAISDGEEALFSVTETDETTALELLETKQIMGIIYVSEKLELTVGSAEKMNSSSAIQQSIIKGFVEQYEIQKSIIMDTVTNSPEKLESVIEAMSADIAPNSSVPLTEGNTDSMLSYFYNLMAMVALFGSVTGLHIATCSQGNLSALGARKCCSPVNKLVATIASLCGSTLAQSICTIISTTYLVILGIDFGTRLPLVYLAGIVGSIMGVSLGFFIGSFGTANEDVKNGVSMTISLVCCFFSGLMVSNMKAVVAMYAPWFNEINPAAVISDAFYCLNIYSDYERFTEKIITMLVMAVIFTLGGFVLTRRKRYASL
ncbi:MAG: ABC transporter permease [Oscillospiraceae bacterium]|nr:ABC transporter permease [Oscillospiraceae bacterium]